LNIHSSPGDTGPLSGLETESNHLRLKDQPRVLAIGALGVVHGDIETSPLCAIRECFHGHHAIALTLGNIFEEPATTEPSLSFDGTLIAEGGVDENKDGFVD
jgi:hypothetical protein